MKSNDLKSFIEQLHHLPTLPPVAIKLLTLVDSEDSSLSEVSRLIKSDPALSSKILRIANSAHFGTSRQVSTLESATGLLGFDLIRSVALSVIVFDCFKPSAGLSTSLVDFWRHSICCAIASELLAERFAQPHAQEAFVAGLLHDLGKLVFFCWNAEEYGKIIQENRLVCGLLLNREEERLGMGHARAGKLLMEYWKFPSPLVMSAWLHHQPPSQFGPEPLKQLPFIVKCANNLCHMYRLGNSGSSKIDLDGQQLQQFTGLSEDELDELSKQILCRFEEVSDYFEWEDRTPDLYLSAVSDANQELLQMQVDLTVTNRRLIQQRAMTGPIRQLQEELTPPITAGQALEKVLALLEQSTSSSRLMGFVFLEQEREVEGRVKMGSQAPMQRIQLPWVLKPGEAASRLKPREQFSLIEQAIHQLEDELGINSELKECLSSGHLIVLPLETNSAILGQIVIELVNSEWSEPETTELLRQYVRAAALAIERVLLVEALDQQTENLAQLVRKEQETQARLYQAQRLASVGRLAAGAAHEINNPLAAILLQAELLLRQSETGETQGALRLIVDQSKRISKIIRDLMGFARPSEPKVKATNVQHILDQTLSVLENRIKVLGVTVRKEYQESVPLIDADPSQLEQVFLNLVLNALQAMGTGGTLTVRLAMDTSQAHALVQFRDTGIGIEPDRLSSIFDPFYTTKTVGEGTGLGLAICYSIITNHRGEISVSSQPLRGSTFTIRLPLADAVEVEQTQPKQTSEPAPDPSISSNNGSSVLVIEDERELADLLAECLLKNGCKVDLASDGLEGLDKLDRQSYDATLLDLHLPHLEGLEVLKVVSKSFPGMPVIVMSGVVDNESFTSAKRSGAFACIKKPFDVNEIFGILQRALAAKSVKSA